MNYFWLDNNCDNEILTDEYSLPSPSMQRKRAVAAPLMTTQPGFTGWIASRPAGKC